LSPHCVRDACACVVCACASLVASAASPSLTRVRGRARQQPRRCVTMLCARSSARLPAASGCAPLYTLVFFLGVCGSGGVHHAHNVPFSCLLQYQLACRVCAAAAVIGAGGALVARQTIHHTSPCVCVCVCVCAQRVCVPHLNTLQAALSWVTHSCVLLNAGTHICCTRPMLRARHASPFRIS
jgi:hypothetical protein